MFPDVPCFISFYVYTRTPDNFTCQGKSVVLEWVGQHAVSVLFKIGRLFFALYAALKCAKVLCVTNHDHNLNILPLHCIFGRLTASEAKRGSIGGGEH